jgi:putative ABC transport system permease protein
MLKNFFILTLKGVRYRPIRGWLTILGVVIGITLVIIIFSLGSGIQNAVSQQLQMFGSDLIIIFPGEETNPFAGIIGGQRFREEDLMDLENISGVKFVVPMETETLNVDYRGEKKSIMFHGSPWDGLVETIEQSQGLKLEEGIWPTNDNAREVVLGHLAFYKLFKNKVRLGDDIIVKSKRMKVVGVVSEIGNQMDDNVVYISLDIFRDLTGARSGARTAFVKVAPEVNIDFVAKQIKLELSKQEVVREFSVLTPEKASRLVGNVLSIIELVLIIIALISLVVGGVGIMNTMYTSVLERTKQIGIMKAIGASSDNILTLFLIESGMIGLIGGVLGVILGVVSAYFIGIIAANFGIRGLFSFASLDFLGFAAILSLTFLVGVLSGILPARQAAKMEPAEALRYE